jgi:Lamin Tail Domain/Concanavalin A-like lectin/glucanases superfamily/CotH kinase protein/Chitobiase/beta-hexosaminidase C-terminal domain
MWFLRCRAIAPVFLAAFAALPFAARADVVISEFLAENDGGITDVDGANSDWVELLNDGSEAVNLAGWRLTDDAQAPAKWQFPSVTINPGARLVVFASGKDRRDPLAELHTNFSLNNAGEHLALSRPDGSITTQFTPAFPAQRADISFGDGILTDSQDLITANSVGKFFVPPNGTLGTTWTAAGFDDSAWLAGSSRLGYQSGTTRPGQPIAYWTFDDTNVNGIPGGPDATLIGAAYDASVPGAIGSGTSLGFVSASNNYVSALLNVSETAYTCSLWFRTSSPSIGIFTVADGELGAGGYDRLFYLTGGNIGARTWNNEIITSTGRNYADSQWHHVVHVFGGTVGGQKIFVDGALVASGAKAQSDFNWQQRVNIGFTNDAGANQYFNGQIDDVAIWSEALSTASISSLAAGTSPIELVGYGPYITTSTQTPMMNVNASAYVRLPFTVNRAVPFNAATLRVRYDDAFVAYIDGTEIARRNAPAGTPAYNASAASDRPTDAAVVIETIDISTFASLLGNGSHVLAIHALNDSAASQDFLLNVELTGSTLTPQSSIYMEPPTPGAPNSTGFTGFVADANFTPKRGFYDAAQNVVVTSATPGATLAYTLDGTDPSPTNGTQVPAASGTVAPSVTIPVSATRYIRAMAYKAGSGLRSTNADTHTYIFTNQVLTQSNTQPGFNPSWNGRVADYGMDPNVVNSTLPGYSVREGLLSLPAISMTCRTGDLFDAPSGIYYDTQLRGISAERKVSVEWINVDGTPGWHVQCGTRLHGNSSRGHSFTPKHPMRLHFREEYGYPKLRQNIFGGNAVAKFDQLLLRGCSTDSFPVVDGNVSDGEQRWNNDKGTYLRDQYVRDALNDLGHFNAHGRYAHFYINGLYWGIINVAERPTASFFADYFGGSKDEWDVLKDFAEVHDGNATAWNAMIAINNNAGLPHETRAQQILGNNPDGTRNPAYPIYLHLPSFMDYMIVHIAAGAEDWPDHNWWVGRRRGALSDGFHFVSWDQEISNDSLTRQSGRGSGSPFETIGNPAVQSPADRNGPAGLYDTFRRAPTFQAMFRERIHQLLFNNGPLSPAAQKARWAVRQAEIDKAIVAESARWGDAAGEGAKKRETTWLANMNYMNTATTGYWDAIFPIDVQRFRNAAIYPSINQPAFSQNGGSVAPGYTLYLTTNQPTAYYTLDGSDPMLPNGTPSAAAQTYQGGTTTSDVVPQNAQWRYLVTPAVPANNPAASNWKAVAFNDSAWPEGAAQLGYGDGDEATVIGFGGNTTSRYITTYFRKTFTVSGTPESPALYLLRDDGAVVYLNGKEIVRSNMHPTNVITWASTALTNVGGADETTFFYTYALNPADFVTGTNVLAVEVHQVGASSDDLSFNARLTITQSNPNTGIQLTQSGTVTARARSASGEWSGKNTAYFNVGNASPTTANVVVSEIHYHPAPPVRAGELAVSSDPDAFEFLEVMNIGAQTLDLTGAQFGGGVRFRFPAGFALAPGARGAVVKDIAAFNARYGAGRMVAGVFEDDGNGQTGLSNGGELITLLSASGATLKSFTYDDIAPWPTLPDGGGPSLVLRNPNGNPDHNAPGNWIASADFGGTPGQSDAEQTFGNWRNGYNESLAHTGDDDGDGILNALEYALALNPISADTGALPSAQLIMDGGQQYPAITFRRRTVAADLALVVEASGNLVAWGGPPVTVLVNTTNHGDGTVTETWRTSTPQTHSVRQYLRIRATVTP